MTTYYVNAHSGSDSNDGLSTTAPKRTWESARAAASNGNNEILLARGQRHGLASQMYQRNGSGPDAPFLIGAYGDGDRPRIAPNFTSSPLAWALSGVQYCTYRDLIFDAENAVSGVFSVIISGASSIAGLWFQRCDFVRGTGSGLSTSYNSGTTYAAQTIEALFEDCAFTDNGSHGMYGGGTNVRVVRGRATRNGSIAGAHGFSIQGRGTSTVTSGWTGAGPIYSRAVTNEVWGVFTNNGSYRALKKNTATPTTPVAGEYGWSAGTLYIHLGGTDPSGVSVTYCEIKNSVIWEQCVSEGNYAFTPYAFVEGAGFQFDDYTSFSQMLRCTSRDNDGAGFVCNNVADSTLDGLVALRNARHGVGIGASRALTLRHLTMAANNRGGLRYPYTSGVAVAPLTYEMGISLSPGCTVQNVAISGRGATGAIDIDSTSSASTTVDSVRADNVTSLFPNQTPGGSDRSIAADIMTDEGRPVAGSPLLPQYSSAGAYVASTGGVDLGWRRDRDGKQARRYIGAYGAAVARSMS